MHCPRCGEPLQQIDRTEDIARQRRNLTLWETHEKGDAPRVDESEHWACFNAVMACAFGNGAGRTVKDPHLVKLFVHHPYRGTNSAPGDSFSISWIK